MSSSDEELDRLIADYQQRRDNLPLPHIANAWNNLSPHYTRALAAFVGRPHLARGTPWVSLSAADREAVVLSFRHAVLLGRWCSEAIQEESQKGKRS